MGIGIVAGPVSGVTLPDGRRAGLEFLDFDDADVHARFIALLAVRGVRFLLEDLPCEETPTGGRHYGYLCQDRRNRAACTETEPKSRARL
jgi:hypothetical protein